MPTELDLLEDILHELKVQGDAIFRIASALEEQSRANEVPLYCPPDDCCPGGFRLYRHKQEYWKNDGKDGDRLYHALPEDRWFRFKGEGAFNGQMVKNHNVWRSRALTEGREDEGDADAYDREPEPQRTDEVRSEDWWAHLMDLARRNNVTTGALATIVQLGDAETLQQACARWLNENAAGETIAAGNQMLVTLAVGVPGSASAGAR